VPPFVAIPVAPGMTFTMGGPLIDRRARVRSGEGGTIPGLYAVGSAAGGFDGGHDVGYAGGLIRGVVTGLAAAEDLAANRRS
ncbi:MAG: FAD-binding protein, partial [Acidimicrobiia bacterium]